MHNCINNNRWIFAAKFIEPTASSGDANWNQFYWNGLPNFLTGLFETAWIWMHLSRKTLEPIFESGTVFMHIYVMLLLLFNTNMPTNVHEQAQMRAYTHTHTYINVQKSAAIEYVCLFVVFHCNIKWSPNRMWIDSFSAMNFFLFVLFSIEWIAKYIELANNITGPWYLDMFSLKADIFISNVSETISRRSTNFNFISFWWTFVAQNEIKR